VDADRDAVRAGAKLLHELGASRGPSRAIGCTFDATAAHDGRIVADIIAEWATTHQDPFTLNLTGPPAESMAETLRPRATASKWTPWTAAASFPAAGPTGVLHHPLLL
jgi:hypothetical protein